MWGRLQSDFPGDSAALQLPPGLPTLNAGDHLGL